MTSQAKPIKPHKKAILIEALNATTHGLAALLSLVGTVFLIRKGVQINSWVSILSYLIYGLSMISLFTNSTLYHSFSFSKFRKLFQKLDHSSIYLLIAGTYTPYLMISIGGAFGYWMLFLIWSLAIAGIVFEILSLDKFPRLSTFMYLGLGWLGVIILYPLIKRIDLNGVVFLALGGLCYSFGTIFYSMKSNKWMHIIWHLFVVAGAALMFASIFIYV